MEKFPYRKDFHHVLSLVAVADKAGVVEFQGLCTQVGLIGWAPALDRVAFGMRPHEAQPGVWASVHYH